MGHFQKLTADRAADLADSYIYARNIKPELMLAENIINCIIYMYQINVDES